LEALAAWDRVMTPIFYEPQSVPSYIIRQGVRLYLTFTLCRRDAEDLGV
jgi:hypothetical protein